MGWGNFDKAKITLRTQDGTKSLYLLLLWQEDYPLSYQEGRE
jgi:hypothetical protein